MVIPARWLVEDTRRAFAALCLVLAALTVSLAALPAAARTSQAPSAPAPSAPASSVDRDAIAQEVARDPDVAESVDEGQADDALAATGAPGLAEGRAQGASGDGDPSAAAAGAGGLPFGLDPLILAIGGVIVLIAVGGIGVMLVRSGRKSRPASDETPRRRKSMGTDAYGDGPSPSASLSQDDMRFFYDALDEMRSEVETLKRQVKRLNEDRDKLTDTCKDLDRRLKQQEGGGAGPSASEPRSLDGLKPGASSEARIPSHRGGTGGDTGAGEGAGDGRGAASDPVTRSAPDADWAQDSRRTPHTHDAPPRSTSIGAAGRTAERAIASAGQGTGDAVSALAAKLVRGINAISSAEDASTLSDSVGATYMKNELTGDLAALSPSTSDRFWLVQVPGHDDLAFLVPGYSVKRNWHKTRRVNDDNPLKHHFQLHPGDDFELVKPAVLRRQGHSWELAEHGQVSGVAS